MSQPTGERLLTTEILAGHSSDIVPSTSEVRELIARRAYEHYQQRGEQSGDELSDWLKAEREVVAMLLAEPPEPARIQMPSGKRSRDRAATKRTQRANSAGTRASGWSKRKPTLEGTRA
jgi:hypothetical protein